MSEQIANELLNVSVQVIDEDKVFQKEQVTEYVKTVIKKDLGVDYRVISVFGSQSTGKSTLLNRLFHTQFDVMNETQRQQTTKGIWLGFSPKIQSNVHPVREESILVMDVEGSDGRERGEDQDFERKAALFALSTSEVLIVNIWEHQVGLYQGANMGLLKTVFEVNLSLFGNKDHKVLLLFVIRDHIGTTPLENLSTTLKTDLIKMWESISKPKDVSSEATLFDYFDLEFTTLSHKVLQPDNFDQDVKNLGDRFVNHDDKKYLFKQDYKQNFPIDGWTLYAENCWDQIQANKDLDLPTQQILVARFRCDEIVKESLETFNEEFSKFFDNTNVEEIETVSLVSSLVNLEKNVLHLYDTQASHYNPSVYSDKRLSLQNEVYSKFKNVLQVFVKALKKKSLTSVSISILDKDDKSSFLKKSIAAKEKALNIFQDGLKQIVQINQDFFNFDNDLKEFDEDLNLELTKLKETEIKNLNNRIIKKNIPLFKNGFKEIVSNPSPFNEKLWDEILNSFNEVVENSLSKFKKGDDQYDFQIDSSVEKNNNIYHSLKKSYWVEFDKFIHEYLNEENVVTILRRKFDDYFNYDSDNIPRVWKNELEISKVYKEATTSALLLLPVISLAKLSNDSEIIPEEPIFEDEVDDDGDLHRFAHILNSSQQLKVKRVFLKQSEISYRDANRSIVSNISKIPPFIYVLLIILGWNEFMAILRNPLYLILSILIGTGFFFVNALNLWGPLETTINVIINQAKNQIINSLKEPNQSHTVKVPESYELDDLSEKKEE